MFNLFTSLPLIKGTVLWNKTINVDKVLQGVPKKASIKKFYLELLTTSIHSF